MNTLIKRIIIAALCALLAVAFAFVINSVISYFTTTSLGSVVLYITLCVFVYFAYLYSQHKKSTKREL
ncbi:hypothetical protein [Vibrio albus]|nr:hypothetical protein [Vibrio albus]